MKKLITLFSLIFALSINAQTKYDKIITATIKDFNMSLGEFELLDENGTFIKETFTPAYGKMEPKDLIDDVGTELNPKYKGKKGKVYCMKGEAGWVIQKVEFGGESTSVQKTTAISGVSGVIGKGYKHNWDAAEDTQLKDLQYALQDGYINKGQWDSVLKIMSSRPKPKVVKVNTDSIKAIQDKKLADDYTKWKAELIKFESQNPAPNNPGAIAKKYVEQGKLGNYKALVPLCEDKLANKARNNDHGIYKQLDSFEEKTKKNTPDGAKNEIGKQFLTIFYSKNEPFKPLVWYIDANSVSAVYYYEGGHNLWYINLIKIGGQWKITEMNDRPLFRGDKFYGYSIGTFEKDFIEKRLKELNP